MDIASEKAALRQAVGRRSALLSPNYHQRASAAICKRLLALPELLAGPGGLWLLPHPWGAGYHPGAGGSAGPGEDPDPSPVPFLRRDGGPAGGAIGRALPWEIRHPGAWTGASSPPLGDALLRHPPLCHR